MCKIISALPFFLITALLSLPLVVYGEVTRKEIISCNLDYYNLRVKEDARKAQIDAQAAQLMQERRAAAQQEHVERLQKAGQFVKKVSDDFETSIVYKTKYDDNLYHVNRKLTDPEIAWVTSLDLDFKYKPALEWKKGHTAFDLDINAGPDIHATRGGTFVKGRGGVEGLLTHTRGKYTLGFRGKLARAYQTSQELKTSAIIPKTLVSYWNRTFGSFLVADWRYLPIEVEYDHKDSLYEKRYRESNTSDDHVGLTTYYRLLPKTDFLFSYDYEVNARPDIDGADGTAHTFWGGVRGKLSPKVSGLIKMGYKFKEMEDETNLNTEVARVGLEYRMTERLKHGIEISRNTDTTTLENESWVETNKFELRSSYVPPFGHERISLGSTLRFVNSGYSTSRKDDTYEAGVDVGYVLPKGIGVSVDYLFSCTSSDIESASYKNNVVTLKLEKGF